MNPMRTNLSALVVVALVAAAAPALALPGIGAWVAQPPPDHAACSGAIMGVAAAGPDLGVAVGECLAVHVTRDGGVTWERVTDHGEVGELRGVDARGDTIVAVGIHPFNWALSYTSLDAGETWTFKAFCVSDAVPIDGAADGSCSDGWLFDVSILPDGSFHAVGGIWTGQGYIAVSRTSGGSWMTYPRVEAPLHAIDFANDGLHGIAVGASGLTYKTTDGGRSWSRGADVPGPGDALDVSVVDAGEAWATGEFGVVARSLDHGETWIPVNVGAIVNFHAVDFTAPGDGRIAGDSGLILRSVAGGAAWVPEIAPTAGAVRDLDFAGPDVGFAATDTQLLTYAGVPQPVS